jgi:ferrous iron transport protein A
MTLGDLDLGGAGVIDAVSGAGSVAQRLLALGFLPGTALRVVQVAPFGDPLTVEIDGWRVSLRRAEAAAVRLRAVGGGAR